MDTWRYLIHKRIAKRSPKNTRAGIIASFHHLDPQTVGYMIDVMDRNGEIVLVNNGKEQIYRSSTDVRRDHPETFVQIQKELDREN